MKPMVCAAVPWGRLWCALVALAAGLALLAGCATDFDGLRREHVETFPGQLASRTAAELPDGLPVGLDDCIRIALANNLDAQAARIDRRLAMLDRKIAFSHFLPHIDLQVTHYASDRQQALGVGGQYTPMSDQAVTSAVLGAQQAIFAPQAWFLYSAYLKGEAISGLVAERTRDLIRLQVTILYFAALSRDQSRTAIEAALQQAQGLLGQTAALAREGLATPGRVARARTLVQAQQTRLAENVRNRAETRAVLLEVMGLSPLAQIELKPETPITLAEAPLVDQILDALLLRPEMHIADRTIAIRKDEVRTAIARFLPLVGGFAELSHSSDSFLRYSELWTFGVTGVLSVFDGFANLHAYRAAKERREQAFLAREQACLQIMLEVIQARSRHDQALDNRQLARQELAAATLVLSETEALWREGLLTPAERLDAVAHHAVAASNALVSDFQVQVTAATLRDVMGISGKGQDHEEIE
ncbi:TolC family protein [Desulfatitalea alkaliphila]|uniref:TolC family protein n=1 Tax=Desulfatitalea alkaliphila TaxID=2929485 RepID=A0AA41R2K8_9BACT|nr:TolC family protein [Desulfatitalea alkaliphila]MCJ8499775.1 TolC family protein [Desulfatitalea alkaliphila]